MRKHKHQIFWQKFDDKGFSLIEILISIVVLVIIMVPLFSNFIKAMQINQKAEKLQLQSNLAASIMEGLKSYKIKDNTETDILEEFHDIRDNFDIIPNRVEDVMRLEIDPEGKLMRISSEDEQATYYFAIHGIRVGSTAYDAFIEMSSDSYKEDLGTMNLYPMPEVINLDAKANGLLFSNGTLDGSIEADTIDDRALSTYILWGTAYARTKFRQSQVYLDYLNDYDRWLDEREHHEMDGRPLRPEPQAPRMEDYASTYDIYYDPIKVGKNITKTLFIEAKNKTVNYRIEYDCGWPGGSGIERVISNQISLIEYSKPVENIYIFYTPSIFQLDHAADQIVIQNNDPANPVNLFVAKQGSNIIANTIKIKRLEATDKVTIYTDISSCIPYLGEVPEEGRGSIQPKVIKSGEEDRLYHVTIKICTYEDVDPADRYKDVLYTLKSTKEK